MNIGSQDAGSFGALTRFEEAQTRAQSMLDGSGELERRLERGEVDHVAREFESLFAGMLVKQMRETLSEGLFGEGPGADTYGGWFDEHVGATLADSGAIDLAGMLRAGLPKAEQAAELPAPDDLTLEEWEDQR